MTDQPDYIFFECPECQFSSVQHLSFDGPTYCPMCAVDNDHDVGMTQRTCRDTDKPEGKDARE